ncbi:MAG: hypothetical protein P8Y16_08200 [Sulfurimonas sp.]
MNRIKFICILLVIFFHNSLAFAQEEITSLEVMKAKSEATDVSVKNLESFGFGPALYFIQYKDEVLKDPKDVRVRGDGSIVSSGSKFSVNFGLEVHYDFAFFSDAKCIPGLSCNNYKNYIDGPYRCYFSNDTVFKEKPNDKYCSRYPDQKSPQQF